MKIADGNEGQAEFWANAGPTWKALQADLDAQVGEHGMIAVDTADVQPGETVIDVGCGTGTSSFVLAARVADTGTVLGLDISPSMVEAASERAADLGAPNVQFEVADVQVRPFDGSADLVFSRFGVMFFGDPAAAFTNLHSALRSSGRMVFVCWQSPAANPWVSEPIEAMREHLDIAFGRDPHAPGPFSLADADRIRSLVGAAGFATIEVASSQRPVVLGDGSLESAVEFMYRLNPATAGLDDTDPELAATLRDAVGKALEPHFGPNGVETDSATWIVHAT